MTIKIKSNKKLISIITPIFNEEENIIFYINNVLRQINKLQEKYNFEIILTDNASTDSSFNILKKIAKNDKRIKVYKLSRNYGYQKSIWTGFTKAKGEAAIEIDCDLQDPPELINKFIKKWELGFDIIYGIRISRQENYLKTRKIVDLPYLRKFFYYLIDLISEFELPKNAGDSMLIDKKIVDIIKGIKDHNIYLRGTIFSLGFSKIGIEYHRKERIHGETKFNFFKSFKLAMDGIISQSFVPSKIASFFGILVTIFTFFLSVFYLMSKLFFNYDLPDGFTTTVVLILFGISVNGIFLGIIGEYIGRIYDQQKNKPITIIQESIND